MRRTIQAMAIERGVSFGLPYSPYECWCEIDRLKAIDRSPSADIHRETREIRDDMATRRGDDARVRDHETAGYGSTAHYDRATLLGTYIAVDGTEHELRGHWTHDRRYRVMDHGEYGIPRYVTEQTRHTKLKRDVKIWIAQHCEGEIDYDRLSEHLR